MVAVLRVRIALTCSAILKIQVSYGEMVGCDNDDVCVRSCLPFLKIYFFRDQHSASYSLPLFCVQCVKEWFHYACVGISEPPKGKWYCPDCTAAMKRRGLLKA